LKLVSGRDSARGRTAAAAGIAAIVGRESNDRRRFQRPAPGAGYLGAYDFVFVATGRNGTATRHEIRVTLGPGK
jgi:hypothetical protein